MKTKSTEYKVGKGKPPKHTQFKKGQSGNPAGRPKGRFVKPRPKQEPSMDLMNHIQRCIYGSGREPVPLKSPDGEKTSCTLNEIIVRKLFADALDGKQKAAKFVLKTAREYIKRDAKERPPVRVVIEHPIKSRI